MDVGGGAKNENYKSDDEHDVVHFIKFGRLRRAGQVMRMEGSGPAEKFLCTKREGNSNKRRGRPKPRWCEEVEWDVARVGCRNWRINVQSREKW